jgi:hypothetical protein
MQPSLIQYVIGVALMWAVILGAVWFVYPAKFATFALLCCGFALGMLAMYIAVHFYSWK